MEVKFSDSIQVYKSDDENYYFAVSETTYNTSILFIYITALYQYIQYLRLRVSVVPMLYSANELAAVSLMNIITTRN